MFGRRARREARERALREVALRNVWQVRAMGEAEREETFAYAGEILRASTFEAGVDLRLDDEHCATVAVQTAVLCHGLEPSARPTRLRVVLYPDYFFDTRPDFEMVGSGLVGAFGAMALAWRDVLLGGLCPSYVNVVAHEVAHVLDSLTGDVDGMPPLPDEAARATWKAMIADELDAHRLTTARRRSALISDYGATDPGEFFAEAASYFIQQGRDLRREHAQLYELLSDYFGIDAGTWTRAPNEELDDRIADLESGRNEFVIREYERVLAETPDFAEGHADLARWLCESGDTQRGLACFDRAVALRPDDADLLHERGSWRLECGDHAGATDDFGAALRHAPGWVEALCDRARARRLAGDLEQARADLDRAIETDPESDLAYGERGYLRVETGDARGAVEDLTRALALYPDVSSYLLGRAEALLALEDLEAAAADHRRAVDLGATGPDVDALRGALGSSGEEASVDGSTD